MGETQGVIRGEKEKERADRRRRRSDSFREADALDMDRIQMVYFI